MAEIIEWANNKGWTIKLTPDEALKVKSEIVSQLAKDSPELEIQLDINRD